MFAPLLHAEKEIPYLSSPVIDELGILSANENRELSEFIQSQKNLIQIQVWVTSLEGESIEGLSYRAATKWALGTEKRDNGILFILAPNEKRMRFEVGRGLEGDVPDILAGRILDNIARPQFREGRYYQGIRGSLDQLIVLAAGGTQAEELKKHLAKPQRSRKGLPAWLTLLIFVFVMGAGFLQSLMGHRFRGSRNHYWMGGSMGGWGGGGGGGGWSGGGGSFGGGGSSSSW